MQAFPSVTGGQDTLEASRGDASASDNTLLNLGPWVEARVLFAWCWGGAGLPRVWGVGWGCQALHSSFHPEQRHTGINKAGRRSVYPNAIPSPYSGRGSVRCSRRLQTTVGSFALRWSPDKADERFSHCHHLQGVEADAFNSSFICSKQ